VSSVPLAIFGLVETIARLFDGSRNFYTYYGHVFTDKDLTQGDFAVQSPNTSQYLIDNINHFGQCGGFTMLFSVLRLPYSSVQSVSPGVMLAARPSFSMAKRLIEPIVRIRGHLSSEFIHSLVADLNFVVSGYILRLADSDIQTQPKDWFHALIQQFEAILCKVRIAATFYYLLSSIIIHIHLTRLLLWRMLVQLWNLWN
jgi:hypothetical protein